MSSSARLSVRIPEGLDAKIEEARTEGPYDIPRSEIVRSALEEHLCGGDVECNSNGDDGRDDPPKPTA